MPEEPAPDATVTELPPPRYETQMDGARRVLVDPQAMAAFTESLDLPTPPDFAELDGVWSSFLYRAHEQLARRPQSAEAVGRLGDLYQAHEERDRALACYRRALELEDNYAWHYQIARVQERLGHAGKALAALQATVERNPEFAPAWFHLGEALIRAGELDRAEDAYQTYVDLQPEDENGYVGLGKVAAGRNESEKALRYFMQAGDRNPNDYRVYFQMSQIFQKLGDEQRAKTYRDRFQSLPQYVSMNDPLASRIRWMGTTVDRVEDIVGGLLTQQRADEAIKAARDALEHRPKSAALHELLASSCLGAEQLDDAMSSARKAVELDPVFVRAWVTLCRIALQQEAYEQADTAAEEAMRLDPNSHQPYLLKGLALALQGEFGAAIPFFERSAERAPQDIRPLWQLAEACLMAGRLDQAEATYKKLLKLKPADSPARERLDQIARRRGHPATSEAE